MDILTLNALGITVMAIFGLWVFYRAAQITKLAKKRRRMKRAAKNTTNHKNN